MSSIIEEFGEKLTQEYVNKIKKLEKVGVLRILPFIQNNPHYYSQFDDVVSLHALKEAVKILESIGWLRKEERDGKHFYSLTDTGKTVTKSFLEILSRIPSLE